MTNLLETLKWRYAVKKFDATKKIASAEWDKLEQALVLSPSSFGLQPWHFFVITNSQLRERLKVQSWNQAQVTDASHFVVFTMKRDLGKKEIAAYLDDLCQTRGLPREAMSGYEDVMIANLVDGPRAKQINEWTARQVYIALGNFMTSAAVLGIDTCPLEGIDPEQYDVILGLKEKGLSTLVCCAAGYRSADDGYAQAKKVRFPKAKVIETID